jgi:hypothetical protein
LRNIKECVCSTPFDHFSKKVSWSVSNQSIYLGREKNYFSCLSSF